MIDVRIDATEGHFKFRVSAVVKHEDKYLFVKMNQNDFYCLPGGHVELGESTKDAAFREMEEELGYPVEITRYLGEIQNFFLNKKGELFHELGYYYEAKAKNETDLNLQNYHRVENDKGFMQQLEFRWMTLKEAKKENFKPECLINLLTADKPLNIINDYRKDEIEIY